MIKQRVLAHAAAVALAASLVAGCAATPSRVDPFEPMNRAFFEIHDAVDIAVMRPAIQFYIDVVPQPIRQAVSNFFNNIDDLISAMNDLLQGDLDRFGNDMGRVIFNTAWGFDQGPYLFVPLLGPTSVRDGAGWITRLYVGPTGYINDIPLRNTIYAVGAVDLRAQYTEATRLVDTAALDRYVFIRNAYLQRRRYLLYDGKPPPEPEEKQ